MTCSPKRSLIEKCDSNYSDFSLKVNWNGFEVHEMRPRGSRSAKIWSSVAAKYDFSPLVTLDFELVL